MLNVTHAPGGHSSLRCATLGLHRTEVGKVVATLSVEVLARVAAEDLEIPGPQHRANGYEAVPARQLPGLQGILQPLGICGMQAVAVLHDGHNLLVALGLIPGQADVGDTLLAQALGSFLVHGGSRAS